MQRGFKIDWWSRFKGKHAVKVEVHGSEREVDKLASNLFHGKLATHSIQNLWDMRSRMGCIIHEVILNNFF